MKLTWLTFLFAVALMTTVASAQTDTTFTYQGELQENGTPANGGFNIELSLWDAVTGGNQIGAPDTHNGVPVVNGKFTVELDFGATAFDNSDRWLEIVVDGNQLSPRQPITRAPYSIQTRGIFVDEFQNVGIGSALDVGGYGNFHDGVRVGGSVADGVLTIYPEPDNAGCSFVINDSFGNEKVLRMYAQEGERRIEVNQLGIGENFDIGEFTHSLVLKPFLDDEALRLIGLDGTYQHGARINFGDGDYAYLGEDEDDSLTIYALAQTAIMGGNVGIGTTLPNYKLEVNGSAGKPGGGSWANSSDRRLKKNIQDLNRALEMLLTLRGVSFEYIDPDSIRELPGRRIGMIAQEVEKVVPDWVETRKDGYKAVTYRGFEALTVEALRELREEKDVEIAALRAENDALRTRLDSVEALVEKIAKPDSP